MSDHPVSDLPVSHALRPGFASVPKRLIRDALIRGAGQRGLRNNRNPSVSRVDRTCANLRLDPAAVARRALDTGPLQRFVAAYSPERPPPRILNRAAAHRAEDFAGADIEVLDAERYEEPAVVAEHVEDLLERASGPVPIAELLGVLGSCHRMVHRYQEAASAIALAIEIADVAERTDVVARQVRRAFVVESDRGEIKQARDLARLEKSLFSLLDDDEGVAGSMISQAILCEHSGQSERAAHLCQAALAVGLKCPRRLVAAHQVRAVALVRVGRLNEARRAAEAAASARPRGRFLTGPLAWLSAQIHREARDFKIADKYYIRAFKAVPDRVFEQFLIGVERVGTILDSGELDKACAVAQSLCVLESKARDLPAVPRFKLEKAIYDLALSAARGELSRSELTAISESVQNALVK